MKKLSFVLFFSLIFSSLYSAEKIKLYIDADTANEVDDLYAIVRALIEPSFDIVGLGSAQWQVSHWSSPTSLEDSQRLNEMLLAFLHRNDIPAPRGAHARLYDWGADRAQHSAAAYLLIREAKKIPDGEKLTVVALGALTNIASAILIDPSITAKIKLYLLGTTYDFDKHIWNKRDFNCVMDIQAINEILDTDGLETHIMPANVAAAMNFDMQRCQKEFAGRNDLTNFLYMRWVNHMDGARYHRTIWDLAVISAILFPEWAKEIKIEAPPENGSRPVFIYETINGEKIIDEFYRAIDSYYQNSK